MSRGKDVIPCHEIFTQGGTQDQQLLCYTWMAMMVRQWGGDDEASKNNNDDDSEQRASKMHLSVAVRREERRARQMRNGVFGRNERCVV